jgi:serine/threonine-protein kinase
MGVVYHATDPAIGRSLAIKTIRIRDIHDEQQRAKLRERLFREARSAGVLSHPNIVTIYDMDETDDGLACIAMAYVNGPTLEKILASEGALSGANMLRILRQTALGLDYAHGRGIVHRDVKPANIMTDEDGAVKITDFGIAKITAATGMTETRTVVGTPNYMSPEQVQGLTVDGRSDQFSLAVIAYEILTGERPFQGEHLSTVVYKIVAEEPADAHRINGTLTAQIHDMLRRGLSKKPEERYPSCSNFVGALEMACAESRGWKTLTAAGAASMPTIGVDQPAPTTTQALPPLSTEEKAGRRPSLLMPFLMSTFVVLVVGGVIVWQAGMIPAGIIPPGLLPPGLFAQNRETVQSPAADRDVRNRDQPPAPVQPSAQAQPPVAPDAQPASQPASQQTAEPTAPEPAPAPATGKPSPFVAPVKTQPTEIVKVPTPRNQDVWVTTNPPGAKATLDDNLAQSCQTPCMLHGPTGVHHLTISQAGYENESREVRIGDTAMDVPPISLRHLSGTLMLSTDPPGASVRINGKVIPEITPAQITLPPGPYTVTVEKGGRSQTQRIELRESPIYLRIPLGQ